MRSPDQPEQPPVGGLRNAAQAAEFLNVSERHIWDMKACGQLSYVRFGRRVLFTERDLFEAIDRARVAVS